MESRETFICTGLAHIGNQGTLSECKCPECVNYQTRLIVAYIDSAKQAEKIINQTSRTMYSRQEMDFQIQVLDRLAKGRR